MLVITRKRDEAIVIGDGIEVRVLRVGKDGVRLGITAPPDIAVHRREIYEQVCAANKSAAAAPKETPELAAKLRARLINHPMIVADWRTISAERMAALFEIERQRWRDRLHWDCSGTLADIERARLSGQLPGYVAFDGGVVRGWSYHLLHRRTLQIGGVVAESAAATARLVGAALNSDEGRSAQSTLAFGYFDAPEIESVLRDRGHAIERYHYLARALDDVEPLDQPFESYPYEDASRVAGLLQRAYEDVAAMRPFARSGRFDEWFEYLTQLTLTNACGAFDPQVSQIARDAGELKGVALVTRIGQVDGAPGADRRRSAEAGRGIGDAAPARGVRVGEASGLRSNFVDGGRVESSARALYQVARVRRRRALPARLQLAPDIEQRGVADRAASGPAGTRQASLRPARGCSRRRGARARRSRATASRIHRS